MFRLLLSVGIFIICSPLTLVAQGQEEGPIKIKRLDNSTDEELRKQLQLVPETGFDQTGAQYLCDLLSKIASTPGASVLPDLGPKFCAQMSRQLKRPEMNFLPWKTGVDCQTGKERAEDLHVFSLNLRDAIRGSVSVADIRADADVLRKNLGTGKVINGVSRPIFQGAPTVTFGTRPLAWNKPEALAAFTQMLPAESVSLRLLMVELVSRIEGKEASAALAKLALFDVSARVREKAVESLAKRPTKEYQQSLLDGMRWTWQPAVDHAAEAIVALRIKEAVPDLIALLKAPDPKLPFAKDSPKEVKGTWVRELVRVNHLSNCLLCHAPSMSKEDLVRGRIPVPSEEPPVFYYKEVTGSFVRADIVYLRQDFSLMQPVEKSGKWPGFQRYDYLMRERKATTKEINLLKGLQKEKTPASYPQRDAVLHTLRELTGEDLGSRTESWLPLLRGIVEKKDP